MEEQFLNSAELRAFNMIQPVGRTYNCQFFPKVKLSDVLEIRRSGLDEEDFGYASRAHFDFIAVKDNRVSFAIELNGPNHYKNDKALEREKRKNYICKQLDCELIRIDLGYLNELRDSHVLPILLQEYFDKLAPEHDSKTNSKRQNLSSLWTNKAFCKTTYGVDKDSQVSEAIAKYKVNPQTFKTKEGDFAYVAHTLQVEEERYCIGHGAAHQSKIFGTDAETLAHWLAVIELGRKLYQYERGSQSAETCIEFESVRSAYKAPDMFPKVREIVLKSFTDS